MDTSAPTYIPTSSATCSAGVCLGDPCNTDFDCGFQWTCIARKCSKDSTITFRRSPTLLAVAVGVAAVIVLIVAGAALFILLRRRSRRRRQQLQNQQRSLQNPFQQPLHHQHMPATPVSPVLELSAGEYKAIELDTVQQPEQAHVLNQKAGTPPPQDEFFELHGDEMWSPLAGGESKRRSTSTWKPPPT